MRDKNEKVCIALNSQTGCHLVRFQSIVPLQWSPQKHFDSFKDLFKHFSKYAELLYLSKLDEKIDTSLMSVH